MNTEAAGSSETSARHIETGSNIHSQYAETSNFRIKLLHFRMNISKSER